MKIHQAKCKFKSHYEVEQILDYKGPVTSRSYLINWAGYTSDYYNTWEPRSNVNQDMIKEFDISHSATTSMSILRNGYSHITYQAIVAQYTNKTVGSLLMDAPNHNDFEDLVSIAGNMFLWNKVIREIK